MTAVDGIARLVSEASQWIRTTLAEALGRDAADVAARPAIVAGHYRRGRRWNCVVDVEGRRVAAVHIVVVPAARLSERRLLTTTDELLGRSLDASKASTADEPRPWLGYVVLIEDDPFWHEAVPDGADSEGSRFDRLSFFVDRVLASNLLDAAMVALVDTTTGRRSASVPSASERSFTAALAGRAAASTAWPPSSVAGETVA